MKFAVIIPAYNEEFTIAKVIQDVMSVGVIVIVVNDASTDATSSISKKEGAIVVDHKLNSGYDAALESGFKKAIQLGVDAVITFDADGQHDAAILNEFINNLMSGCVDIVIGERVNPARIAEYIFNIYGRVRFGVNDLLCGLKGYKVSVYKQNGRFDGSKSIGTELILFALRNKLPFNTIKVSINSRNGKPRFGSIFIANFRIIRALFIAIFGDIREKFF